MTGAAGSVGRDARSAACASLAENSKVAVIAGIFIARPRSRLAIAYSKNRCLNLAKPQQLENLEKKTGRFTL
jgi:hypothetical protein